MLLKIVVKILYFFRKNRIAAKLMGVKFGKNCKFIGDPSVTFGSEPWAITIGDDVELSYGTQIITHDGALWSVRRIDEKMKYADVIKPVKIGSNVYVGTNVVILPGVTVGNNVVIGAGAIVKNDIPDNAVAVGVPAKVIETIEEYKEKIIQSGYHDTKNLSAKQKKEYWKKLL